MNPVKVAVTGAAGQIAYQFIFSLLKGEVFGDRKIQLHLIDIPQAMEAVSGVMMEIEDCAMPLLHSAEACSSEQLDKGFNDIDFAFLIGASPRKAGMERSDLLEANAKIFIEQGKALSDYAKQSVNVLVVGNPCNTNCLIAMKHARNIPSKQFYAMTMLDQHRAMQQIAIKEQVDIDDLSPCFIYGNHSATQYPDFENVEGISDPSDAFWNKTFIPMIQTRGAKVIGARGASSAASAAHAAIKTAWHIANQSSSRFSVAKLSQGEYGSPMGLIVSLPSYFKDGQCITDEGFSHTESAIAGMQASFDELKAESQQIVALGIVDD